MLDGRACQEGVSVQLGRSKNPKFSRSSLFMILRAERKRLRARLSGLVNHGDDS